MRSCRRRDVETPVDTVTSAPVTTTMSGLEIKPANALLMPAVTAGPSVDDVPPTASEMDTTTLDAGAGAEHVVDSTCWPSRHLVPAAID